MLQLLKNRLNLGAREQGAPDADGALGRQRCHLLKKKAISSSERI